MSAIKNYYHEEIVNRGYDSIDEWWNMMDEDQEYIEEQCSDDIPMPALKHAGYFTGHFTEPKKLKFSADLLD